MKKDSYIKPEMILVAITEKDILAQSDVLIDGSGLFDEEK